jgi:hypothetical protein
MAAKQPYGTVRDVERSWTSKANRDKGVRILARSLYRELTTHQGYDSRQVVALATELLHEVTERIANAGAPQR